MVHLRKPEALTKNHDSLVICVDPISEPLGSRRRLITVPEKSWALRSTYQTIEVWGHIIQTGRESLTMSEAE